ncbi:Tripartite tricarboxylate transporter family receptor [Pigmentiphaga humi]|uniref:Tripartite tricarboxylate transporter family receptor n=1 Tax=Pigmentiphaga humi TaxID=2478468 RepID=A0A3P4AX04_9BURK|nr:tripartite tricarboxylate transporter substrate binding protein [Pigmentiphaga humi]VCU68567.1 Tripartite tricarboxylate transporter family receptor [Pigmentiphaga humi]
MFRPDLSAARARPRAARAVSRLLGAAFALLAAGPLHAQGPHSNQPLTMLIGYPPGAIVDTVARQLANVLGPILGQTIVPENKGGAAGLVGAGLASKARPDGSIILFTAYTSLQIAAATNQGLSFDPVNGLLPVASVGRPTTLLLVSADFPAKTFEEFVALVKSRPGIYNFGTSGIGSPNHFALEHMNAAFGLKMTPVPYKGAAQMLTDMLGGRVQAIFGSSSLAAGHLQSGTVRALAIGSPDASPAFPKLPVIADNGAPGLNASGALGVFAPPSTPPEVVERLNAAINTALKDPAIQHKLQEEGIILDVQSAAAFGRKYRGEAQDIAGFIQRHQLRIQ